MIAEFKKKILKLDKPRIHKIKNSNGVYDAYKWIRKNGWLNIGRPVTEHEFYTIIRQVNSHLVNSLLNGNDIELPHRLGTIELRKYKSKVSVQDGKVVTNLPVDWDRTLKLWSEDRESYTNKLLIRMEEKEIFKILYNKKKANYENKSFYVFEPNRNLKVRLKQRIKNKDVDAFLL